MEGALTRFLLLLRPVPLRRYVLQTDASGIYMDQERHIFTHLNALFSTREQRCQSNEQMCVALVWGIRM
jgi:hypothetical protein